MKNIFFRKVKNPALIVLLMLVCLVPLFSMDNFLRNLQDNEFLKALRAKLGSFQKENPEDRVYLQSDKPFYRPGETIWFSAYVRDGESLQASQQSDIVHVELINPKGSVDKHLKIVAANGIASGDFVLGAEAPGGIYKIKAYTNWQKNDPGNVVFEKTLMVQDYVLPALKMKLDFERKAFGVGDEVMAKIELQTNENKALSNYNYTYTANLGGNKLTELQAQTDKSGTGYIRFKLPKNLKTADGVLNIMINYEGSTESISRSIPIILNKISFQLFPEGGDLVANLPSRVAFSAKNEFGKPADVEGAVYNSEGKIQTTFSSFHMGMGAFNFKPEAGERYTVKITKPEGIDSTYELPEVLSSGFILNLDKNADHKLLLNIYSTYVGEISLVLQIRGKIYYSGAVAAQKGVNKVEISTANFPIGTAQITLFDTRGVARAERLVFVNKDKQLQISVTTDKEQYQPREKVKMKISVKDDKGMPVAANLSMSVVDDQLLSFADDRSGNILSQLLLEQDIHQKVEEPAFYFNPKEAKSDQALDYLLMTSGWRRFTWKQLTEGTFPKPAFVAEQAIISGLVYDGETGKPLEGATVTVGTLSVKTGKDGRYAVRNTEPVFPMMIQIKEVGYQEASQYAYDYMQQQTAYLYSHSYYQKRRQYYSKNKRMAAPCYAEGAGAPRGVERGADMEEDFAPQAVPARPVPAPVLNKPAEAVKEEVAPAAKDEAAQEVQANVAMPNRMDKIMLEDREGAPVPTASYFRSREFAAPVYNQDEQVDVRNDFRSTIYWNGNVAIDGRGEKTLEFYNSDNVTSFRVTVEGIGTAGAVGHAEKTYFTQLPFSLRTKLPVEVVTDDMMMVPLTLKNNTAKPLGGILSVKAPAGFEKVEAFDSAQTIMPGTTKVLYLKYRITHLATTGDLSVSFKSCGLSDAFTQNIKVISRGFPVQASFSGQNMTSEYNLTLINVVNGSLQASFTAYPSVTDDLLSGIEGILREPYGCFEQTSMSSYPNTMVLDYLNSTDDKNEALRSKATMLLEKGYTRLTTFETADKGYEWFGSAPGHEALSAYGLMQFADMQRVGAKVDQKMVDRTAAWLMSRSDGKGGFLQNQRALDNFGRGGTELTDTYITYALAEAGYDNINKELNLAYDRAMSMKDPYYLALAANAMYSSGDVKRGDKLMELLYPMQAEDGSWNGKSHSITHSTGQSLLIETTSLVVMAILKQEHFNNKALTGGVQYLIKSRSGNGTFGNTQGTVLALKALTAYAKASRRTASSGTVEIYVGKTKVGEKSYVAGEKGNIEITGLEKYLSEGKNKIKVVFKNTKEALPYSISVKWNTTLPSSADGCAVKLNVALGAKTSKVGETNRLAVTLKNSKDEAIPNPIAVIGIPAGFTAQPWQLKELQEKNQVAYYEVIGNNVVFYFRSMAANEVKNINLDLKAELPGEYNAPASCAYLYYTNEFKDWKMLEKVTITAN